MVVPVEQTCPECGTRFIGSDMVGLPCMDCHGRRKLKSELFIKPSVFIGDPVWFLHVKNALARVMGLPSVRIEVETNAEERFSMQVPDLSGVEEVNEQTALGYWPAMPEDPLLILVCHSDSEGVILQEHLMPLAQRLNSVKDQVYAMHENEDLAVAQKLYRTLEHMSNALATASMQNINAEFELIDI